MTNLLQDSLKTGAAARLPRHPRAAFARVLLPLGDLLATGLAAPAAFGLWALTTQTPSDWLFVRAHAGWMAVMATVWPVLNLDFSHPRLAAAQAALTSRLLTRVGLALVLVLIVFFLAPQGLLPRRLSLYFIGSAFLFSLIWRQVYRRLAGSPYWQRRVLVVGAGWPGEALAATLAALPSREYRVLGFIEEDPARHHQTVQGLPVLGGAAALLPAVRAQRATEVILAIMGELQGETFQALLACQAQGVPVLRMSAVYEAVTGRVPIEHLDAELMASAFIQTSDRGQLFRVVKRLMDLVLGAGGLLLLGLALPFIAAAIWLESRGPVFYHQTRMGQSERLFTLWKFRTMIPEAEPDGRARWAEPDDERVTRVGRFLRRFRLDELPQFWSVVSGEMSLIGPRPERPALIAELAQEIPFYGVRHLVKPGLTGWAQINYGYGGTLADAAVKLQWDLYYLKHRSVWLDLLILYKTIGVVLSGRGT